MIKFLTCTIPSKCNHFPPLAKFTLCAEIHINSEGEEKEQRPLKPFFFTTSKKCEWCPILFCLALFRCQLIDVVTHIWRRYGVPHFQKLRYWVKKKKKTCIHNGYVKIRLWHSFKKLKISYIPSFLMEILNMEHTI